jgi:hypothetical protein
VTPTPRQALHPPELSLNPLPHNLPKSPEPARASIAKQALRGSGRAIEPLRRDQKRRIRPVDHRGAGRQALPVSCQPSQARRRLQREAMPPSSQGHGRSTSSITSPPLFVTSAQRAVLASRRQQGRHEGAPCCTAARCLQRGL